MNLADKSIEKQQDTDLNLPTDSAGLLVEIDELTRVVKSNSEVISKQKKHIAILEEALRLSKIKRFAPSSEQSQQLSLFDEAENEADSDSDESLDQALDCEDEENIEDEQPSSSTKEKKKPGRKPFSDKLPREQIFLHLSDEEKQGAIDTFSKKSWILSRLKSAFLSICKKKRSLLNL